MEASQHFAGAGARPPRRGQEHPGLTVPVDPSRDVPAAAATAARRLALQDELDRLARHNAESGLEVLTLVAFLLALTAALLSPSVFWIAGAMATFGFGALLLVSGLGRWRRMNELETLLADPGDRIERSSDRIQGD